jgi:hypothetical protein
VPSVKQSAPLWWFNGESPAGYAVEITMTLVNAPAGKTFDWSITQGGDEVAFDGAPQGATVSLKSTGASPPAQAPTDTVTIKVVDDATHDTVCSYGTRVYAPYSLAPIGQCHYDYGFFKDPVTGAKLEGYTTYLVYAVLNQFGSNIPANVPVNEQFNAGSQHSDQNNNWGQPQPQGSSTYSSTDIGPGLHMDGGLYAGAAVPWLVDQLGVGAAGSTPVPVAPTDAAADQSVEYWTGAWRVGSEVIGDGQQATCASWGAKPICKWHLHLGYGRHE